MSQEFTVVWTPGSKLPNGVEADELYMHIDAFDRQDAWLQMFDLYGIGMGEVDIYDLGESAQLDLANRREVIPDLWIEIERCKLCDARVINARAYTNLARVLVDADRDKDGTVVLVRPYDNSMPIVRTLQVVHRFGRHDLRTVHRCKEPRLRLPS